MGEVAQIIGSISDSDQGNWKLVDRRATSEDLIQRQNHEIRENELVEFARKVVKEKNLEGVKIVSFEFSLDSSKLTILYSFEGEEKVDLRSFKHEISRETNLSQIELRQIGPRDVAKIFGGMGACGLPTRCCSKFLTDFSSISIRMAKTQGISLTPAEITGMCGRLRCCLIYEYEHYAENRKLLPKRNKRVMTPVGEGKVIDVLPLKMGVVVYVPEVGRKEFNIADIELLDASGAKHDSSGKEEHGLRNSAQTKNAGIVKEDGNKQSSTEETKNIKTDKNINSDNYKNRKPRRRRRRPGNQGKNEESPSSKS